MAEPTKYLMGLFDVTLINFKRQNVIIIFNYKISK